MTALDAGHAPSIGRARLFSFGLAILAGIAVAFLAPHWLEGPRRTVAIWDAASLVFLLVAWLHTLSDNAGRTQQRAASADPGRHAVLGVIVVACVAGFMSAIGILGHDQTKAVRTPQEAMLVYGLGIFAIVAAWTMIHTAMTFRYAHLYYYDDGTVGGIEFPGERTYRPDDYDFAYFSFVIGMTFQVSDVQITDPGIRRLVLVHGLISFAFNAAIIAVAVNIATGLLH